MGVFRDISIDLISQHSYLEVLTKIARLNFILIMLLGAAVCIAKHLRYYTARFDLNKLCSISGTLSSPRLRGAGSFVQLFTESPLTANDMLSV